MNSRQHPLKNSKLAIKAIANLSSNLFSNLFSNTLAKEKQFVDLYPKVKELATAKDFGGWSDINKKFFADGAIFDQIQSQIKR